MLKKMPFLLFGYVIFVHDIQYYQDLKNKIRYYTKVRIIPTFPSRKIKYRAITKTILLSGILSDIERECKDAIVEELWNFAWDKLARGVIKGLPEWYKRDKLGME